MRRMLEALFAWNRHLTIPTLEDPNFMMGNLSGRVPPQPRRAVMVRDGKRRRPHYIRAAA